MQNNDYFHSSVFIVHRGSGNKNICLPHSFKTLDVNEEKYFDGSFMVTHVLFLKVFGPLLMP